MNGSPWTCTLPKMDGWKINFLFGPFAYFQGRLQLVLRSGSGCSSSNGVFVGMSNHETVAEID